MSRKGGDEWWRINFEEDPAQRPGAQIQAQAEGVEKFIRLEPRARILDLSCGSGRLTLELARRGYRVLGLDVHEEPLAAARRAAKAEKFNVHFLNADIRRIHYRSEFDAVVSMSTSFGYLPRERDDLRALEGARQCLKCGGHLLLDLLNKEWLMRHFEPNFWEQGSDGPRSVVLDRVAFDFETGRLDNHRTIVGQDGARSPSFVSLRVYTLTEIRSLLERAGLTYLKVWGGFDASAYGMDSPRMIVCARKSGPEPGPRRRVESPGGAIRIKGRRKGG